jgi:hypothetical protein
LTQHFLEIASNRDLVNRICDGAVLNPESCRTARIVTGHIVDALPHQLGDDETTMHLLQKCIETLVAGFDDEIVYSASVAGRLESKPTR